MSNLLEIKGLEVQYVVNQEVSRAVNGIDLVIEEGRVLGLVGETGAGKTTTALAILKLLPKYVSRVPAGQITFDGIDITNADESTMRDIRGNKISMIFQDPMTSLNPTFSVGFQIADVIKLHNPSLSQKDVEARVDEILRLIGIPSERRNEFPHQFSGGMKQRIMIGIAIACQPKLLIADEPTTALDVTIQAQIIRMMRNLQKELNSSILMITHDLGIVANFCDDVAVIYAGEIIEKGRLEDVFDRSKPHHPYTDGLFGSIPDIHSTARRLESIPGLMPDPTDLPEGCKFHPRCKLCSGRCKRGPVERYISGSHEILCHRIAEGGRE